MGGGPGFNHSLTEAAQSYKNTSRGNAAMLRNFFRKNPNPSDSVSELDSDATPALPIGLEADGAANLAACAEVSGPLGSLEAIIRAARSVN